MEKWNDIIISISKNKLLTALTALGLFWGIFMLVILLGVGEGLQNGIYRQFRADAKNTVWIYSGRTSKEFQGLPANRQISFTNDNYNKLRRGFPEVPNLAGRSYLFANQTLR